MENVYLYIIVLFNDNIIFYFEDKSYQIFGKNVKSILMLDYLKIFKVYEEISKFLKFMQSFLFNIQF